VRFSKVTCLVESSVLRETLSGEISSEKVSGLRSILGFATWLTCGNPSCFSNNRFLPLTFGVFAKVVRPISTLSLLVEYGLPPSAPIVVLQSRLLGVGSNGGWLQWSLALSVATASLHCKSDLVHGIGWLSVVARWQRLRPVGKRNLLHVFFDLAMSGLPLFLFPPAALGDFRGRMLAGETVMAVEPVCLLRHSSPAGWLARLHWQSTLLAC
jgi:hypothetical protein